MPNFYWVGGSTGTQGSYNDGFQGSVGNSGASYGSYNVTWLRAFDWNNPLNWMESTTIFGVPVFVAADRCPSQNGDIAYFGKEESGGFAGLTLRKAVAPCLWGGAYQAGVTLTWQGGGASGANYSTNSDFNGKVQVYINPGFGKTGSYYPFLFFGTGLQYAGGPNSLIPALIDAEGKGFSLDTNIWYGESWTQLAIAALGSTYAGGGETSGPRLRSVSVRAQNIGAGNPAQQSTNQPGVTGQSVNHGYIRINSLKSRAYYVGTGGASYQDTEASVAGSPHYIFNGRYKKITHHGPIQAISSLPPVVPGYVNIYGEPRPHLSLIGVTAGEVISGVVLFDPMSGFTSNNYLGRLTTDTTSNIGSMIIRPQAGSYLAEIQNSFNRSAVAADLGLSGAGGSADNVPSLKVESPVTPRLFAGVGNSGANTIHGVLLAGTNQSSSGVTMNANFISIGSEGSPFTQAGTTCAFAGSAVINRLDANNIEIVTARLADTTGRAKVTELYMDKGSVLNFRYRPNNNNWEFGNFIGNQVYGGIIARDETSRIIGSQGVRLWNEQLISSFRSATTRSGVKKDPISSASLLGQEFI